MTVGILANHREIPPFGLNGGEDGKVGENYVERKDGKIEKLEHIASVEMQPQDLFVIKTPGGGRNG